jgi:hypothetical protein
MKIIPLSKDSNACRIDELSTDIEDQLIHDFTKSE